MKKSELHEYFATIGAKGGKKSKRKLTKKQAQSMVKAREAKRKNVKDREQRSALVMTPLT